MQEASRALIYAEIVSKIQSYLKWPKKEAEQLLLRYIFIKKTYPTEGSDGDDEVFPHGSLQSRQLANDQLFRDIRFKFQDEVCTITDYLFFMIENCLDDARKKLQSLPQPQALLGNEAKLAAARMRYSYIGLGNHGLARDYGAETGLKPSDGFECFASPFNHYFDRYCSAFADLESECKGNCGSFWTLWKKTDLDLPRKWFVNPPFDETIFEIAEIQINYFMDNKMVDEVEWVLPDWPDCEAKDEIINNKRTTKVSKLKKGEMKFIDFVDKDKRIAPCDLVLITWKAS